MSIPADSPWRGCAAAFPQPVEDERGVQFLVETIYYFNCRSADRPLHDVIYRSSDGEADVTRHVFRWDTTPYAQVFQNGFQARRQEGTDDRIYYNLNHYVHHGGRPLDSSRPATHVFVSTTLNSEWRPSPSLQPGQSMQVYRYEIYAPGGIWVNETLGDLYQYPAQDEVAFVGGIAPQYVRSAQLFIATREPSSRYVTWRRADTTIRVNGNFSPQAHPCRMLPIRRPIFDYRAANGTHPPLTISIWRPQMMRGRRAAAATHAAADPADWYAGGVADWGSYINAAFRAYSTNEAYLFMKNEYVRLNYAPGTTDDKIVYGPVLICDGFPSLIGTAFGEHGIDCAFDSHNAKEAFIFSGNLCAHIDYAPGTSNDKILHGPMTITAMFPFFKRTEFESSVDAAFADTARYQAYLFKGDSYAKINYHTKTLMSKRKIVEGFYSLRNTIFQSGIEAAFASHRTNEAYIFKGDQYALINFAPGTTDDYIMAGPRPIVPYYWPSLRGILPHKNRGLDDHDHHNQPLPDRDHDEL